MKATLARNLVVILSLNLLTFACGQRTSETPTLGIGQQAVNDKDRTEELEKLIRDQSELLNKLSTEKATLSERSSSLESQITALNKQLADNKSLSDQQKVDLEKRLRDLQDEKAKVDKAMTELSTKNAQLEKQLADAKAENDRLQRDLAAARAANQQAATTTAPAATTSTAGATSRLHLFKYADPNKAKNDCLNVPGSSTADNVQISSIPCVNGAQYQQFFVVDPTPTYFTIRARHSGKCLAVNSTAENAAVVQEACTNTTDQSWEFFVRGQTDFRLRNQFSGKCMKIQADGKIVSGDCSLNSTYFNWFTAS
jgi:myosin heavy subunit